MDYKDSIQPTFIQLSFHQMMPASSEFRNCFPAADSDNQAHQHRSPSPLSAAKPPAIHNRHCEYERTEMIEQPLAHDINQSSSGREGRSLDMRPTISSGGISADPATPIISAMASPCSYPAQLLLISRYTGQIRSESNVQPVAQILSPRTDNRQRIPVSAQSATPFRHKYIKVFHCTYFAF
jgi:hypothetical protein